MRRLFFLVVVIALMVMLVSVAIAQDDEIELVIWGEPGTVSCINEQSEEVGCIYARYLNDSFAEKYPNITLKWEDHGWDEALRQNLVTAQLGGTEPDITVGETFMPALTANGSFLPLAVSDETMENLVPGTVAGVTYEDQVYGVAAFTGVFALEVNADVVRAAGLDPDALDLSTWDAVAEVAAQITEAGDGEFFGFTVLGPTPFPAAAMFRAAPYVFQAGADFCDEGCVNPTFNDAAAVPVYEWFREMYSYSDPALVFNGDEGVVFTALFEGKSAMQTAGSWHPGWAAGSGCEDCRYFPLPLPEDGNRANVVVGNAIYSALATTEYPEEAMLFLEHLVSDDVQNNVFWVFGGRLPTTFSGLQLISDVSGGDTASVPDYIEGDAVATASNFDVFIDELINGDVRILPPWASNGPELNTLWNDMFTEVMVTDRPVQEILDEFQAQAEELTAE